MEPPSGQHFAFRSPRGFAPLVDCLYAMECGSNSGLAGVVVPDGQVEFIFHLAEPGGMRRTGQSTFLPQPRAFAFAQRSGCLSFAHRDRLSLVAFRTSAPVAGLLLGEPIADRWNVPIDLFPSGLAGTEKLLDRLCTAPFDRRLDLLEGQIEQWLRWITPEVTNADLLVRWFMTTGRKGLIRDHVKDLGLSHRTLNRRIGETGLAVRDYRLLGRIMSATWMLRESSDSVVTIAVRAGFYDHAEFSTRFRQVTGYTPTALRRLDTVHFIRP